MVSDRDIYSDSKIPRHATVFYFYAGYVGPSYTFKN